VTQMVTNERTVHLHSFCIGGTGLVYEGRGWDVIGTHAPNYNSRSTGICFIGDFRSK